MRLAREQFMFSVERSSNAFESLSHLIKLSLEAVLSPEATLTGIVRNILSAVATSS